MRLTEASYRYLTVRQQDGYSRYTLTAYRFQHQALIHDLGDREVHTLMLDDFRAHLAHYGHLRPASLGHKIRTTVWLTPITSPLTLRREEVHLGVATGVRLTKSGERAPLILEGHAR